MQEADRLTRATTHPYPGAFSIYKDNKIVINKIEYSGQGFDWKDKNGLILTAGQTPIVKTPNGAVRIMEMVKPDNIILENGKYFE